ncbi:hypothetical protein LCGC14_2317740, partial [marine sediment metagenome]
MVLDFGQTLFKGNVFQETPDDGAATISKQFAIGDTAPTLTTIG